MKKLSDNKTGKLEISAANKVLKSGKLSGFYGSKGPYFYGGKFVKKFEKDLSKFYNSKYAITVNSWTSGLVAIFGSLDLEKGDEVILPPWTMTACMASVLNWNLVPVFCDIEKNTFNIDPIEIEKKITKKTKAILAVDIFGHPANVIEIRKICKKYNLKFILDCAQSPYSKYKGRFSSEYADVAGYSFNYHKHISTGEGGVIVTSDKKIARKLQLVRNHGEMVVEKEENHNHHILGFNFRLGELEAAIGIEQLKKLKKIVREKQALANYLNKYLKKFKGIITPITMKHYTHSYYGYAMRLDRNKIKTSKKKIENFLKLNQLPISTRYQSLYKANILRSRRFLSRIFKTKKEIVRYITKNNPINFKNNEDLNNYEYLGFGICDYNYKKTDLKKIFDKLYQFWKDLD
jgi:dTDP-4-amino-4,6-dideoxygalactose transaminase